jgi:Aerobic-type carbon monoxide dehydrogenase, large subunit CoxL/CutL homologs
VGVYTFPAAHAQVLSVLTNTNSTAPYRGAGRPESTFVIERLIDDAARELGMDRVELRRKNLIDPAAMPYKTALGVTYDCGEFRKNMDEALDIADIAGFPARREASRQRGRLRGWAVVNPIEQAAGPQPEFAEIRFSPSGSATVFMGTRIRARATRPPSSRSCTSDSASIPPRSGTSTAIPTASLSGWAPWAPAPR